MQRNSLGPWKLALIALTIAIFFSPRVATAGNGGISPALILGNPTNGTGVRVHVDGRWIAGDGYRTMRLNVETIGGVAAAADRQLTIRIRPSRSYRQPERMISKTIELPAGMKRLREEIYYPENLDSRQFEVQVCLGRFNLRRSKSYVCNTNNSQNIADSTPRVLVIDSDAPTFEEMGTKTAGSYHGSGAETDGITNPGGLIRCTPQMYLNSSNTNQNWPKSKRWCDAVDEIPVCTIISPLDIPAQWIGLTSADIVCISFDDLQSLEANPKQLQSLLDWTSHGGNLFITGCGSIDDKSAPDSEKRNAIAKQLGLPTVPDGAKPSVAGWKSADQKGYGKLVEELTLQNRRYNGRTRGNVNPVEKPNAPAPPNPISYRNLQLGTVVIFPLDEPLNVDNKWYWNWVYKTLGKERWMWVERNGLSGSRENRGFWSFMVPGVGLAPVKTFVVLLTLFVVGIGPVSFVVLKKWKRPNWLMFTVPIAAMLVTLGLIAYALLTDGLSVRARSRTITHINQRTGREATWSRQAYYAGLPPGDGLRFPGDCAVYPIDFAPGAEFVRDRVLDLTTDQHFRRGYLGARETAQFMVQRCGATDARVEIKSPESDAAANTLTIVNHLGGELEELYLRDEKGQVFYGAAIKDQDSATLELLPNAEVASRILDISGSKCLLPPPGVDPNDIQISRGVFGGRSYYSWNNYQSGNNPSDCLAEQAVADYYILTTNTYLAVMRKPVDVPAGTAKVRWDQTMHLIMGEW